MVRAINMHKVRGRISHVTTRQNDHVTIEIFNKKMAIGFEIATDRLKVGDGVELSTRITDRDYELAKLYYHRPYNQDEDQWKYLEGFAVHISRVWPVELLNRFYEAKEVLSQSPELASKIRGILDEKVYYGF
jgi:hypothetical protein